MDIELKFGYLFVIEYAKIWAQFQEYFFYNTLYKYIALLNNCK